VDTYGKLPFIGKEGITYFVADRKERFVWHKKGKCYVQVEKQ